jgi:hypothetical protein
VKYVFFLCDVYNQIQHKLQMSSPHHLDYLQEQSDPEYAARIKASVAADAARDAAAARVAAAAGTADTIAKNAIRRQEIQQQIDKIVCPACKRMASILEYPNYKCQKCGNSQGGSKRKSKSQRRKKSKSQRRKKSIKRRH